MKSIITKPVGRNRYESEVQDKSVCRNHKRNLRPGSSLADSGSDWYRIFVRTRSDLQALVLQSLILKKDTVRELDLAKEGKALLYMAVFAIYVILFDYSFIVASIFLGTVTLLFTKSKRKLYYVIVMITVIVLYLLFTQVLHVRLK